MTLKLLAISFLSVSVVFISCTQQAPEVNKNETPEEVTDSSITNTSADNQENSYKLPSALQIAYVFKKAGGEFDPKLPNDKLKAANYNTSNYKSAVNFGIYSADLAYCLFNKKYTESKEYLKACKTMGSYLGLNQAFESDNLVERFDKNLTIEDSVVKIVSNVQLKTDILFEQNKQQHISVIAFAGAWTESLYIATKIYSKEKNKKVLSSLMEQLLLSEVIVKALKKYESADPEIKKLIPAIEKIHHDFNAIAAVKSASEKDEEMNFTSMAISDTEIDPISQTVNALRASMVE